MKYQPNRNYQSNDVVYTPDTLAQEIVSHFKPVGKILEPCCGGGAFLKCMPTADWCEIEKGRDFFELHDHYDWIVTNPPWSKIRDFLRHSMEVADNIVFLMTVNHAFTKARVRDVENSGFCIKEISLVYSPKEFPQSGFQLAAVHYAKGSFCGMLKISKIEKKEGDRDRA